MTEICSCCGRKVIISRLKIHSTLAAMLCRLYALGEGFHHVNDFRPHNHTSGRDFSILKHWGLVVNKPADLSEDKKTSGMYAITDKGQLFVRSQSSVPKYLYVFNNTVQGESTDKVEITNALGSLFSWKELTGEAA